MLFCRFHWQVFTDIIQKIVGLLLLLIVYFVTLTAWFFVRIRMQVFFIASSFTDNQKSKRGNLSSVCHSCLRSHLAISVEFYKSKLTTSFYLDGNLLLPSPPLSERKCCVARRLCVRRAAYRLRAALVSAAMVMRCIQRSLVFLYFDGLLGLPFYYVFLSPCW